MDTEEFDVPPREEWATHQGSSLEDACEDTHFIGSESLNVVYCIRCGLSSQSIRSQFPNDRIVRVA